MTTALLEHCIRDVLGRLQLLANGATQQLNTETADIGHEAPDSKIPAGVELRSLDDPPDKDRCSLYEWFSWHFARHAGDEETLFSLYTLAEIEYKSFRFHSDVRVALRKGELDDRDATDGGAAERNAAERVVDWYEGVPALVVAMIEKQNEAWVRKARAQHARNPEDGRPRAEFYEWDEERRRREVAVLAHLSQQKAADHLGVVKSTVQRYWPATVEGATVAA